MKSSQIKVGGFYVRELNALVREVVQEVEDGGLYWRSYDLSTGRATGDSLVCSRQRLATWADREASDEEVARIRTHQTDAPTPDSPSLSLVNKLTDLVLKGFPTSNFLPKSSVEGLKWANSIVSGLHARHNAPVSRRWR